MTLTVRLTARTERAVNALAKQRHQTRSDVVRDALEHYAAVVGAAAGPTHPSDAWLDVIGVVRTAARDKGRTTGEQFTAIVREKARARRTR